MYIEFYDNKIFVFQDPSNFEYLSECYNEHFFEENKDYFTGYIHGYNYYIETVYGDNYNDSYNDSYIYDDNDYSVFTEENLPRNKTGLKYVIWLDDAGENRNVGHHLPRLKVIVDGQKCSVIFDPIVKLGERHSPAIERKVRSTFRFIEKNRELFLKHWKHEIDFEDVEEMIEI